MTLLTIEQMEYAKCEQDPVYFTEKYLKNKVGGIYKPFKMYGYQKLSFENIQKYQYNIMLSSRQSGMTSSTLAYLLWYAIFHNKNKHVAILSPKADLAEKLLEQIVSMLQFVPSFIHPGIVDKSKTSITLLNDSMIISASTGVNPALTEFCSIVYVDSCAYMANDDKFFKQNSWIFSNFSRTRVILQSSANGVDNEFFKIWQPARLGQNKFKSLEVNWINVPNLPANWREDTIQNIGDYKFSQEYENKFLQPVKTTQGTREYIEEPSVKLTDNHLIIWWGMADIDNVVLSYDEIKTCFFEPNIMRRQPVEIQDLDDPYSREHRNKMRGEVKITTRHDEKACFPDITFQTTKGGYKLLLEKLAPCPYSSTEIGIPVSSDCKSF